MKSKGLSLRSRLLLWQSALMALLLAGFGFTTLQLQRVRQLKRVDDALLMRIGVLVDALRSTPRTQTPSPPVLHLSPDQAALFSPASGFYFAIWMLGNEPIKTSQNIPPNLPKPTSEESIFRTRGATRETHLAAAPVNCVLVGHWMNAELSESKRLATGFAAVGCLILGVGIFGGWVVSTRALAPLARISQTAVQIAQGNLAQRIPKPDAHDELSELISILNETFDRLQAAFERQTQFTADAAHELRTPLSVLLTLTQSALMRPRSAPEYQDTLAAIERNAQRMRQLVELLLHLARLDAGTDSFAQKPVNLAVLAAEGIQLLEPLAHSLQITFETDLQTAICCGDAVRLSQVINNLISNAVDYNKPGGRVFVSTRQTCRAVILEVEDTGHGIPQEDLPHIFERFQRGDKSRARQSKLHCGLGLAIAHAVVKAHRGHIEAQSTPGIGSSFVVSIPTPSDTSITPRQSPPEPRDAPNP